jgi:hypothetical protein
LAGWQGKERTTVLTSLLEPGTITRKQLLKSADTSISDSSMRLRVPLDFRETRRSSISATTAGYWLEASSTMVIRSALIVLKRILIRTMTFSLFIPVTSYSLLRYLEIA